MPADLSLTLYYTSLGLSAVGVVLFLWLMREPADREPEPGSQTTESSALTADPTKREVPETEN